MKTKLLLTGILSVALVFGFFSCSDDSGDDKGGGGKVATPTASPTARAVASGTEITLTTATTGATIYYTTDGSAPTASSTAYSNTAKPKITAEITLKAIAVKAGMTDSDVFTAVYTINTSGGETGGGEDNSDIGINFPALTGEVTGLSSITITDVGLNPYRAGGAVPATVPQQSDNGVTWSVNNQKLSIKFETPTKTLPISEGVKNNPVPSLLFEEQCGEMTISDANVNAYIWGGDVYRNDDEHVYCPIERSKITTGGTTGSAYQIISLIFYLYVEKDVTLTRAAKTFTAQGLPGTYRAINLPLKAGWNLIQLDQDAYENSGFKVELKIADKDVSWRLSGEYTYSSSN
jgi:hypothetical protein